MNGKEKCSYLKAVRREVAAANGLTLDMPECTHEGDCMGTCPRCESEVRQLEEALSLRKNLAKKVSILGVAVGMAFSSATMASAQTIVPADSTEIIQIDGEIPDPIQPTKAEFIGGMDSLQKFLAENFKFPPLGEHMFKGTIWVEFVVEETGEITHVKVIKGLYPSLDEEAKRLVSSMPPWKPAQSHGQPARSTYTLPITIQMED
ncbi:MAG: energy transducer TonB [Bacteroidales bacterium]|nr:energy transducer TonB [Bacteroidales bacterium]